MDMWQLLQCSTSRNFIIFKNRDGHWDGRGRKKREVIWSMFGAQTTEQGNCSKYGVNVPHRCKKNPSVVDLLPGTLYNQQIANCCKEGLLSSSLQDTFNSASSFQLSVGEVGTDNKTVKVQ